MEALNQLVREGRIAWVPDAKAWSAKPDDIVDAVVFVDVDGTPVNETDHPGGR
jgi:hypothetical protein